MRSLSGSGRGSGSGDVYLAVYICVYYSLYEWSCAVMMIYDEIRGRI